MYLYLREFRLLHNFRFGSFGFYIQINIYEKSLSFRTPKQRDHKLFIFSFCETAFWLKFYLKTLPTAFSCHLNDGNLDNCDAYKVFVLSFLSVHYNLRLSHNL